MTTAPASFLYPAAHGAASGADLLSMWAWEPTVPAGCVCLLLLYALAVRGRPERGAALFAAGVFVIFIALVSPLDLLSDEYLFSAHMLQHLLLVLVAPPLLLAGLPTKPVERLLRVPLVGVAERALRRPGAAWAAGVLTLWVWHVPALYNAALADERVHVLEHLCFLVSAAIFWWPLLAPREVSRLPAPAGALYLFTAAAANVLLGIYFTFAPPGLYPAYLHPDDAAGLLHLLRDDWGISAGVDQQLGGLIMWVPGGLIYLAGILAMLARWYSAPETDESSLPVDPAPGEVRLGISLEER